jgi:hypothetical protein
VYEQIDATGVGVSISQLTSALFSAAGKPPPALLRHFDVALGHAEKHTDVVLAPNEPTARASAISHDYGVLVAAGSDFGAADGPQLAVDASYAHAVLNYDDALFTFFSEDVSAPPSRIFIDGVAAHLGVGAPLGAPGGSGFGALMLSGLAPLAAVDFARDQEHVQAGDFGGGYDVDHVGFQFSAFNVVSFRFGHVTDRLGDIDGSTRGFGVALPVGDVAGIRFDYGTLPQAQDSGLHDLIRRSYSAFFDPLALWRRMR